MATFVVARRTGDPDTERLWCQLDNKTDEEAEAPEKALDAADPHMAA